MNSTKYITVPNLFTTLNLFCGFLSVTLSISGHFLYAAWIIFAATVLDGLDGKIARASGENTQFGLQMDSLSDLISSGMAPAILVYKFYFFQLGITGLFLSFLPLLFAAFRLARFNVLVMENGNKSGFYGLPAPMAAVSISSVVILFETIHADFLLRTLVVIVPIISLLMASTIPYDTYPRFNLREKGANRIKLLIFLVAVFFLVIYPSIALSIVMLIYLLSGPVLLFFSGLQGEK